MGGWAFNSLRVGELADRFGRQLTYDPMLQLSRETRRSLCLSYRPLSLKGPRWRLRGQATGTKKHEVECRVQLFSLLEGASPCRPRPEERA